MSAAPSSDGTAPEPPAETPAAATGEPRRHGAGPGGRAAAILLVVALAVVAVLVLYWGITR